MPTNFMHTEAFGGGEASVFQLHSLLGGGTDDKSTHFLHTEALGGEEASIFHCTPFGGGQIPSLPISCTPRHLGEGAETSVFPLHPLLGRGQIPTPPLSIPSPRPSSLTPFLASPFGIFLACPPSLHQSKAASQGPPGSPQHPH